MDPPFVRSILAEVYWGGTRLLVCLRRGLSDCAFSGDESGSRGVKQALQIGLQISAVFWCEVDEFEGLKIALGRPHGKKHACLGADCVLANVEDYLDFDSLIQWRVQMKESAGD